jgi:mRNA interferase MazF
MNPGDVVLAPMPLVTGAPAKLRPALVLALLPGPYQTHLLSGISTQLGTILPNWDELIQSTDADFAGSGLYRTSVIRLSYLHAVSSGAIGRRLGSIDPARLVRLRTRLAAQVRP